MQRYDAIENGIEKNDINALREAVGSICYTSRDFSSGEFDEIVRYVEAKGIKLKDDALIGSPLISSTKSSFSDEDFARAVFELKQNFCDERIGDVKKIGKALYASDKQEPGKRPNAQSHQQESRLPMIAGLVAVVIIIAVVILLLRR